MFFLPCSHIPPPYSLHQLNLKAPLCPVNKGEVFKVLAEMDTYIYGLKEISKDGYQTPVLRGTRHVCFTGVLICNQSVRELYERLVEKGPMNHLPTYLLSQDHLECYFGKVSRSHIVYMPINHDII